ncbi:Receptor-type tyrosine-protein phosphatase R [Geodia barretti]|uniref:protein-tyrosine-phosphatase n=1 Tax=Geodia barretti TaxID=519541 RepID=A0AA35TFF0_GEOBA|nr:Receptor-type tyrosine-protein phosphatase R [Geodia barretti]
MSGSAGLGRSGTFMAIDMGIQQYEAEGVVDPLKYMCEMRQDRGGIIQTADQYIYIHRALRDYITTL